MRTQDPEIHGIGKEYSFARKLIKPIADQCAGIITGNHDERNAKHAEIDLVENICDDFDIAYLKNAAYSKLKYEAYGKKCSTLIYLVHGFSSSRQRGGKVNALEALSNAHQADVYVSGHTHDMFVTSSIVDTMTDAGNYNQKTIYCGNTGTFLRSYVQGKCSYSETAGYRPNKVGYLRAVFNPTSRKIKMEEVVL
jgi:hypothetical protein